MSTNQIETITPKKAAEWLEKHNTTNRPKRPSWVDALSRMMKDGRFHLTHQGIAFNCDGTLLDGQHRLMAIVQSGVTVKMYVARGIAREATYGIDQHRVRTITDLCGPLMGLEGNVTNSHAAIARVLLTPFESMRHGNRRGIKAKLSPEEIVQFIRANYAAIDFAYRGFTSGGITRSAFGIAPVARAWYSQDHERLTRFMTLTTSPQANVSQAEIAPVLLRDWVLSNRPLLDCRAGRVTLYLKTEAALRAFLAGRSIAKLQGVEAEVFHAPFDSEK